MIAAEGIPKPAFNAFRLLHGLGEERIELNSDSALLTRRKDGALVLAVWNYAPAEQAGAAKTVTLRFKGTRLKHSRVSLLDPAHGDVHAAYEKMGSPRYPTPSQVRQLRAGAELPVPEIHDLKNGELTLTLPAYGLALIQLK